MIHPDRRNNTLTDHERFSNQSIEEFKQRRYKKSPSDYKESCGLRPVFHKDVQEGRTPNENVKYKVYSREGKWKESNRTGAI